MPTPHIILCELGPDTHGLESMSPYVLKVHRALKFHGLAYERRHASRPIEHKAHHPRGQVPVLLLDGKAIPDSTAILKALEGISGKSLLPDDPNMLATAWLWEDYADRVLGYYVFAARWFDDRNWPVMFEAQFSSMPGWMKPWLPNYVRRKIIKSMRSMEFIRAGQDGCWNMFTDHLDLLEARTPQQGFWLGDTLTVADVSFFGMLHCLRSGLSPWQMEQINQRPKLCGWLDRIQVATE
jgi:glutathione S-transferase